MGLNQTELAKRAGIQQSRISELETGFNTHPKLETLVKLSRVLGVSEVALIRALREE